jgi:hypothetical protein
VSEDRPAWRKAGWRDANGDLRLVRWADTRALLDQYAQNHGIEIEAYDIEGSRVYGLMPAGFEDMRP